MTMSCIPDGAIQRYNAALGRWLSKCPLGPIWNITDPGYGAVAQSFQEWIANPAQAAVNQQAFETIFAEIRASGRLGQIYVPAGANARAYYLTGRLQPWCGVHIFGDGGRGTSNPSILHSQYGAPALLFNHYLNQDSPPPNATSCQGSVLRDFIVETSGNATQLFVPGAPYSTGVTIRPTAPTRGTDGVFGPYWIYLVVVGGYASTESDPTASWPKSDGAVFTNGTMTLMCLIAGGIRTRATIFAERVHVHHFYGDQWSVMGSAGDGIADACLFDCCGGSQSAYKGDGIYLKGADANICKTVMFEAIGNAGWGIHDESFLGNTHDTPHTESNILGPYNLGGDLFDHGMNAGNFTLLLNGYSESDQPPSRIEYPGVAL